VLLWAIFGFVLVGGLLAASLNTASSQRRAAGASAKSKLSFYAAEAGLRQVLALASDTLVGDLEPGDSLVLAWTPVTASADYRATIHRVDGGTGQKLYLLNAIGRSGGAFAGYSAQNLMFTLDAGPPAAAIVSNGPLEISGNPRISGECADVAANGPLRVGGTLITAGAVSSTEAVEVVGAIVDWEGQTVTAEENADPVFVPPFAADDHCEDADVVLRDGWVIDPAASDSVTAESSAIWSWNVGDDAYTLSGELAPPGTVCAYGSLTVSGDPGTALSPLSLSLISTGFVDLRGNPFIVPDLPSGLLILGEGDVRLNGEAGAGSANYAGLVYGGSQCDVSGTPTIQGQVLCRNGPEPTGVASLVAESKLNGDLAVTSACTVGGGASAVPIRGRAWSPVF